MDIKEVLFQQYATFYKASGGGAIKSSKPIIRKLNKHKVY